MHDGDSGSFFLLAGLFCMGMDVGILIGMLFAPVLLFEFFPYWFILRRTNRRGKASVWERGRDGDQ